jgi:hypothetical protein
MNSLTYLLHGWFSHITVWVQVQRGWLQLCLYAPHISFLHLKSVIVLWDFWKRKYDVKRTLHIGITLAPIAVGCFRMQWVITRPHTCVSLTCGGLRSDWSSWSVCSLREKVSVTQSEPLFYIWDLPHLVCSEILQCVRCIALNSTVRCYLISSFLKSGIISHICSAFSGVFQLGPWSIPQQQALG